MGIDEVSERLGALDARVQTLTETWKHQDKEANEARRRLHNKFEDLKTDVTSELRDVALKLEKLVGRIDNIDKDMTTIKPKADLSHDERQQAIGGKKVLALVWMFFVGLIGMLTTGMVELVHWWLRAPPPSPPPH